MTAESPLEVHDCLIRAIGTWVQGGASDVRGDVQMEIHKVLGQNDGSKGFLASPLGEVLSLHRANLQARVQGRTKGEK